MPELPEVETVRRGLVERIIGERIASVWLGDKPEPFKSPRQEIARVLVGARIIAVRRMGKHIVIDVDSSTFNQRLTTSDQRFSLIIHLGMTGAVQVTVPGAETLKHTHAIMHLDSGKQIRFVDPRRFGRIWISKDFAAEGIEPLQVTFEQFASLFRGRKTPIKSALLNQRLLRGLGNIYADESLFRAGLRPRRRTASLTRADLHCLFGAIRRVLRAAIAAGGSSVSDYFDVEGEPGLFQTKHRVYGREGKSCRVCGTAIKRIVVGGRGTHYCPECQK